MNALRQMSFLFKKAHNAEISNWYRALEEVQSAFVEFKSTKEIAKPKLQKSR